MSGDPQVPVPSHDESSDDDDSFGAFMARYGDTKVIERCCRCDALTVTKLDVGRRGPADHLCHTCGHVFSNAADCGPPAQVTTRPGFPIVAEFMRADSLPSGRASRTEGSAGRPLAFRCRLCNVKQLVFLTSLSPAAHLCLLCLTCTHSRADTLAGNRGDELVKHLASWPWASNRCRHCDGRLAVMDTHSHTDLRLILCLGCHLLTLHDNAWPPAHLTACWRGPS